MYLIWALSLKVDIKVEGVKVHIREHVECLKYSGIVKGRVELDDGVKISDELNDITIVWSKGHVKLAIFHHPLRVANAWLGKAFIYHLTEWITSVQCRSEQAKTVWKVN